MKTDRLDLGGLLSLLARHQEGDRRWRVVRVPDVVARKLLIALWDYVEQAPGFGVTKCEPKNCEIRYSP